MLPDRRRSVPSSLQRVLLLAPYFLPRRRVGSMRPFRFAIHLREFGWEPTILTIASPEAQLTDKEAHLLKDIRVLSIASPIDRTFRSESQLGAPSGKGGRPRQLAPASWIAAMDRQFPVDAWFPLFAAKFGKMLRKAAEVDPQVVWATGDPWSGLVAGQWLSKRLGVPYIADFRDPWTCPRCAPGKNGPGSNALTGMRNAVWWQGRTYSCFKPGRWPMHTRNAIPASILRWSSLETVSIRMFSTIPLL